MALPYTRDQTFVAGVTIIPPGLLNNCQGMITDGRFRSDLKRIVHAAKSISRSGSQTYASGREELLAGGGSEIDYPIKIDHGDSVVGFEAVGEVLSGGEDFRMELVSRTLGGVEIVHNTTISPTSVGIHKITHTFATPIFVNDAQTFYVTIIAPNTNASSVYSYHVGVTTTHRKLQQ